MKTLLLAASILGAASAAAGAAPIKLTDAQMDRLAAGFWGKPVPVVPPITVNPGGPILISCTVGAGCTIRRL